MFAGGAAVGFQDSLQSWKQLFQQDEQLKEQQRQFDVANQRADESAQEMRDFEERMARLGNKWENKQLDRQEAIETGSLAVEQIGNLPYDQAMNVVGQLEKTGNPFALNAKMAVRKNIYKTPEEALSYLDSLQTSTPGQRFDVNRIKFAAQTVGQMQDLTGKDLDNYVNTYVKFAQNRNKQGDVVDENGLQQVTTATQQARATLSATEAGTEQTQATTRQIGAETLATIQQTGFDKELQPLVRQNMARINRGLELTNSRAEMENGQLPAVLDAELALLTTNLATSRMDNKLKLETWDAVVGEIEARSGIAGEELRHLVTTGTFRDAIVRHDATTAKWVANLTKEQVESERLNQEATGATIEDIRARTRETNVTMLNTLIETGGGDLVNQLAPDLLNGLGVTGDRAAQLVPKLAETANRRMDAAEKIEYANVLIAEAESEVANRTVDSRVAVAGLEPAAVRAQTRGANAAATGQEQANKTYYDDRAFQQRMAEAGLEINQGQLQLGIDTLALERQALEMPPANTMSPGEVADEIYSVAGSNPNDITEAIASNRELETEVATLATAIQTGDMPPALQEKYGMDPAGWPAQLEVAQEQARLGHEDAVNRVNAVIEAGALVTGRYDYDIPGINAEDPIYLEAVSRLPHVQEATQAADKRTSAVASQVNRAVKTAVTASGGVTPLTAKATYDSLLGMKVNGKPITREELAAAGYSAPVTLQEKLSSEYQTFGNAKSFADRAIDYVQERNPDAPPIDINDASDRREVVKQLNNEAGQAAQLRTFMAEQLKGRFSNDTKVQVIERAMELTGATAEDLEEAGVNGIFGTNMDALDAYLANHINMTVEGVRGLQILGRY